MFEISKMLRLEANSEEYSSPPRNEEEEVEEALTLKRRVKNEHKRGVRQNNVCKFCSLNVGPTPQYHQHIYDVHRDEGIVCDLFLDDMVVCKCAFPNMIARNCHRKLVHPDSTKWIFNHAAEGKFRCKKQCRVRIDTDEYENHTYQHHKNGNDEKLYYHDQLPDREEEDEALTLKRRVKNEHKRGVNQNNVCKFCSLHAGPTPQYHQHIYDVHRDEGIVCNLFLDDMVVCKCAFPNMIARNCHRKLVHPDSTKWMFNHAAEGKFRCKKQCRVRIDTDEFENHTYQHHKNGNDEELYYHDQLPDRCPYRCTVHMGTYNSISMHQSKRNHPIGDLSIKIFH